MSYAESSSLVIIVDPKSAYFCSKAFIDSISPHSGGDKSSSDGPNGLLPWMILKAACLAP